MDFRRSVGPQPPRCSTQVPHRRGGSMAGNFLERSRHGTVFYFRRRVPLDLVDRVGKRHIYVTLRTHERRTALLRARVLAVQTDRAFEEMRKQQRDWTVRESFPTEGPAKTTGERGFAPD